MYNDITIFRSFNNQLIPDWIAKFITSCLSNLKKRVHHSKLCPCGNCEKSRFIDVNLGLLIFGNLMESFTKFFKKTGLIFFYLGTKWIILQQIKATGSQHTSITFDFTVKSISFTCSSIYLKHKLVFNRIWILSMILTPSCTLSSKN